MPIKQIVKTNKRVAYLVEGNSTFTIGLTASAFYDLTNSEQLSQSLSSGITAGSACLTKVISGGACTIEQKGETLFKTSSSGGDYNFERFTLRSMTAGATAAISVTSTVAVVEFVVGHPDARQIQLG